MKFTLEIELKGAALMGDDDDTLDVYSLSAIVENLVEPIESGVTSGIVMDYNGNKVGRWEIA